MSRLYAVASVPVKPTRRTPRPEAPFGLGIDAPLIEAWTGGPFLFVWTEPAILEKGRYCLAVYVDGLQVDERWYDGGYSLRRAKADAAAMVAEHNEFHRAYEVERFERWMEANDRLPALCGGAPDDHMRRHEPSEADRRWWAANCPSERRGRGVNVTDEDVIVATGCCG